VASPSGSDSNSGTVSSPYLTVQKLVNSLSSGQTGCLRQGKYASGQQTNFSTPGITITSYPGERATVAGFPYITGAGEDLSYLDFELDKTGDPWPALCQGAISGGAQVTYGFDVEASNVTVEHDNIYVDPSIPMKNRGDGIGVGWQTRTSGDILRDNRIHDVGFCPVEEHGIYLNKTTGIQVYGNWIYDIPAGTGIQVWDGPQNAHIYDNVIDHTSSCVDIGDNSPVTTGNVVEHNICSNMVGVQSPYASYCNSPGPGCTGPDPGAPLFDYWGGGSAGSGNVMQNNLTYCASTAHCTTSYGEASGVSLSGNTSGDPQFADPNYATSHDYRVASGSPAASWGLWDGDAGSVPPSQPAPAPGTTNPTPPTTTTSPVATPTPTPTVPATPGGVRATAGNGQVTIAWSANQSSDSVTHYNLYRTDQTFSGAWATPTSTTFTNSSSVVNGTQYCYQVSATNASGESSKSAAVCATPAVPPPPTPKTPSVPTGLKAVAKSSTSVQLTWTANAATDKVTHYDVYRTDATFSGAWAMPTSTWFTNASGVLAGHQYCYQLSATNSVGDSAKSAAVCVTTPSVVKAAAAVITTQAKAKAKAKPKHKRSAHRPKRKRHTRAKHHQVKSKHHK
jgi:hypothetical protein